MRLATAAVLVAALLPFAGAQAQTVAAPPAPVANYDPTMSAKEAVLANWELAAAGVRAGAVLSRKVVAAAQGPASYAAVARQAQFAQKTMVQRVNAAMWVGAADDGAGALADGAVLAEAVAAAAAPCAAGDCAAERAALEAAFARAALALDAAAGAARGALTAREAEVDAALMAEQLGLVGAFLDGGAWAQDLTLTAFDRDGEEVAARIVGAMALWRNLEPYVGLRDPALDAEINHAARELLRTLRRVTRGVGVLAPDGPELAAIQDAASTLAARMRRAAALFAV